MTEKLQHFAIFYAVGAVIIGMLFASASKAAAKLAAEFRIHLALARLLVFLVAGALWPLFFVILLGGF